MSGSGCSLPLNKPRCSPAIRTLAGLFQSLISVLVDDGAVGMDDLLLQAGNAPAWHPAGHARASVHIARVINRIMLERRRGEQGNLAQDRILGEVNTASAGGHRLGQRGLDLRDS